MANVTGGDLHRLWRVSEVHLPRIADAFFDASRTLGGATGDQSAFPADDVGSPGTGFLVSSVGGAWEELRFTMQALLTHMGDVVVEASQGVRVATEVFNRTDSENAEGILEAYHREYGNSDVNSLPPAPGAADYPVRPASAS
jgi:hypothetical protein